MQFTIFDIKTLAMHTVIFCVLITNVQQKKRKQCLDLNISFFLLSFKVIYYSLQLKVQTKFLVAVI